MNRRFPEDFLLGAAMSAHQVEGGNTLNDWWAFEHAPQRIKRLKRLGHDPAMFVSDVACDHYRRFEEDFDLARSFGHNAHRLSLEWSRIEPREGVWDAAALTHYRNVISALRKRSIEPVVTLHHFTNPLWFAQRGGWGHASAPRFFARYVERVAETLGSLAAWWVTINEPTALVAQGYLVGAWPPQRRNPWTALRALRNLAQAHRRAYEILKCKTPDRRVGLAYAFHAWEPATNRRSDRVGAAVARAIASDWFLRRVTPTLDFIGVNYYFSNRIRIRLGNPVQQGCGAFQKSDLGWDICPQGLEIILHQLWERHRKPLLITENGIADADDSQRTQFILEHLLAMRRAMARGVDVRGYLYWSLMDNFEWAEGFSPRFGLVEVNYETMERRPRPSAGFFAEICRTKTLPDRP